MKVYVWEKIEHCSNNYHEDGGVVVFAETLDRAMELAEAEGARFQQGEEPDVQSVCDYADERVFIMPDAGCC